MSTPKKKKKKKTTPKRRRKTSPQAIPKGTGLKIAVALTLLIGIVVGAGLLLHRYLPPAPGSPPAVVRPQTPVAVTKKRYDQGTLPLFDYSQSIQNWTNVRQRTIETQYQVAMAIEHWNFERGEL